MKYLKAKDVIKQVNITSQTLRNWANTGKIKYIRSKGNIRLYDIDDIIEHTTGHRVNICYCRVSSRKQKEDLERQVQFMQQRYPNYRVITDIGSGLNFKRKGLKALLELCYSGTVGTVVVAHRDRLARFGFELIRDTIERFGGQLVVLDNLVDSPECEITRDILTILHVFSCRMHGLRKYAKAVKADSPLPDTRTKDNN